MQTNLAQDVRSAPPSRTQDTRQIIPFQYPGNQAALRRLSQTTIRIQPKLEIGAVNDPLEAEADLMADRVMRMTEAPLVQRKCAACEEEEDKQH